jgi:endoglucanase
MSSEERKRVLQSDELFIDIGAMTSDEAEKKGAYIGMTGVFDAEFLDLGDGYLRGKALDDRAGCFIMAEVFKAMKDSPYNVIAVGTVQEEVGLRGAVTAAWQVDPEYGLALEGTFAIDVPGSPPHKQSAGLKKGPVVTITDRGLITHPKVLETITRAANSDNIPYQYKKIPSGRTDASSIHLTKAGIPSGTIAAPCRYIHGPVSITTVEDLENTIKLVTAFIIHISNS